MSTRPPRAGSTLVMAALVEGPLFLLFIATFPLIHTAGIGVVGAILSLPQTPGLIVAGALEGLITRVFGYAPGYVGIPVFFATVFIVQWLLIAVVVGAWRLRTSSGPWSSINGV